MLPNVLSVASELPDAGDRPPGKKAENAAATDAFQLLLALWSPLSGAAAPSPAMGEAGGGPLPAGGKALPGAASNLTANSGSDGAGVASTRPSIATTTGRPVATIGAAPLPILTASTPELATPPDGVRNGQGSGGAMGGATPAAAPILRSASAEALPAMVGLPPVPGPRASASLAITAQLPAAVGPPAQALPALAREAIGALTQNAPAVPSDLPGSPSGLRGSPSDMRPAFPAAIPGTPPLTGGPAALTGERPGSAGGAIPAAFASAHATPAPGGLTPPTGTETAAALREAADAAGRTDIPTAAGAGGSGSAPLAAPLAAAPAPAPAGAPPGAAGAAPPAVPVLPPIDVPPGSAGWSDALGGRVTVMARHDLQHAEIHLHPAELGPLRVQVSVDDGKATLHFHAQHALTRDAIEQALPRLRDMLGEHGLSLGQASVSGHGTGHEQAAPERDPAGGRSASPLRATGPVAHLDAAPPIGARHAPPGRLDLFA